MLDTQLVTSKTISVGRGEKHLNFMQRDKNWLPDLLAGSLPTESCDIRKEGEEDGRRKEGGRDEEDSCRLHHNRKVTVKEVFLPSNSRWSQRLDLLGNKVRRKKKEQQ